MSDKNHHTSRRSFTGTGFYIALFLGVTALAVAGYWMLLPSAESDPVVDPSPSITTPVVTEPTEPVVPDIEPEPEDTTPVQSVVEVDLPDEEPPEPTPPVAPRLIVSPLTGETIAAFSIDQLSYNETLSDWRTHDGIDIAASVGTQVLAACSGTVLSVSDDDLMGTTVILSHDGGYETIYSNLQDVPTVSPEQYVSAGQVIGAVGTTSLIESSSQPHLHFAVTKDGSPMDPNEFLNS